MDPSSSIFKPRQKYERCRGEKQKMLRNSIGRQLPYIVNFKKSTCQIFDAELEKTTHSFTFPDAFHLVDVDYFPTEDGQLGVLVAIHDESAAWGAESFVVALVAKPDEPTMLLTHSARIPARVSVVKTLFSSKDMKEGTREQNLGLYHRLLQWNHIVAVGCRDSKCFLAYLSPMSSASPDITVVDNRKALLNLMGPFIKNGNLVLNHSEEDLYREYPTGAVSVTALALMPRSRTLLVGFSMGAILAAALNPSNNMVFLELRHERIIRELAPLEPEDDPDKFEYFIAAVDRSSRHPIMLTLYRGAFNLKANGLAEPVDESEKYDRPTYNMCLEHKIPYGERWLAVAPIITERAHDARKRDDSTMDSMLNVSQSYGCSYNRSRVLLGFEKRKLTVSANAEPEFVVEAAIFDIDAWYYKRVPYQVSSDGSVLKQCAFMSNIRSSMNSLHVQDIGILALDSNDVIRFASLVSDADQLFYPSALSFSRVFVMDTNQTSLMRIQSIQQTILEKCASRIGTFIRSPDSISPDILAAGLVRKTILSGSPNSSAADLPTTELSTDQKIILNAMVYYGKIDEFCSLASRNDLSDRIKMEIAEWAVHEAIDHKRTISDRTVTLFEGRGTSLSPLAENTLLQGIQLFLIVHEYLKTCSRTVKEGGKLRSLAHSVKCLRNHTRLVSQFINFGIVPPNYQVQYKMREMHERRKTVALRNKSALPIQVVTRNMHRIAPEGQFWNNLPHDEWYPPTALDLLESILNVNVSERFKRELIVQYVIDWLRVDPERADFTDKQLATETIRVMTNNMLEVDYEKIYYILDEERAALKKKSVETTTSGVTVFSLHDDGLTYEQLWSGDVLLNATISKADMERFEQRLRTQLEEGKRRRLAVLDPDTEKLYQMFLFEKQRYDLMSSEAIESNELLRSLLPGMIKKSGRVAVQKSVKEREIEEAVRAMFEKQEKHDDSQIPEVFAAIGGRKRRSEAAEGSERTSPGAFVPPTAKRIPLASRIPQNETTEHSANSSSASPTDPQRNAELNMMIATPARYYRRPMTVDTDMVSPPTQRLPPVPAQNSILKTAKAVQSPSRGRIRFHESVRRAVNESVDSTEEVQVDDEDEAPRPKGLNFAILEDQEEEEITPRRTSRVLRQEDVEDEPIEMEKSFEKQQEEEEEVEEFDVLEDVDPETFETRTDDVAPGADETFELAEKEVAPMETSEEQADDVEKTEERAESPAPEEHIEDVERTEERAETPEVEDAPNAPTEHIEQAPEAAKAPEEHIEHMEHTEQAPDAPKSPESPEDEFAEPSAPWDGIHRSFEVQKDEDCEPVEKEDFEDAHEELKTLEVQEDEPQPTSDLVTSSEALESSEDVPIQDEVVRPPSANTRSKANSRSATPTEEPPKTRRARTPSVQKTDDDDDRPLSRRTRGASAKRTVPVEDVEDEEPKKTRASSVKRSSSKKPEELDETLNRTTRASSVKRTVRSRAASEAEPRVTRSRATTPARTSRATTPVEDVTLPDVSGSSLVKRVSAKRSASIRATSVETSKTPTASAPSTPRRGRPPKVKTEGEATPAPSSARATRASSKRRTPGPEDVEPEEAEPPKKSRGRPRATPLRAIPEAADEPAPAPSSSKLTQTPKRGTRSRSTSTSSTTAATPKRGRKPTLEGVVEEEEEEPATPTRRSSRRLGHQP